MALTGVQLKEAARLLGVTNLRPLVQGGQKVVAEADGPSGPTIVKLVEIAPPFAALALERARREVGILAAITHPNVVALEHGLETLGTPPAAVCWLEEALDGADLRTHLGAPMPWTEVVKMIDDVANGLTAFHDIEVVHRDLSPGNVRRLSTGSHKLMDPGIARLLAETSITGSMHVGTPGYMSPEHVSPAAKPTYGSDVYCLGILAYEALTGTSPIPYSGDFPDYARRLYEGQAPSVAILRPDLTKALADLVDACLQRQLARRFLDAHEVLRALGAL